MEERCLTVARLEELLHEAEQGHAEYEKALGHADENWPAWYARYIFDQLPPQYNQMADEPETLPSTEPFLSD